MASSLSATIVFVACNAAPAEHFSAPIQQFPSAIVCAATGPADDKFRERKVIPNIVVDIQKEEQALDAIMKVAKTAKIVITDVGNRFSSKVHERLMSEAPEVARVAWYENPERFVPGYSPVAEEVMKKVQYVWFSNANLEKGPIYSHEEPLKEVDFTGITRVGIGNFPLQQAEHVAHLRRQRTVAYMGGNNEEYFTKAFPAFLGFITEGMQNEDLSHLTFVLQQHPSAKKENRDGKLLEKWQDTHRDNPHAPKLQLSSYSQVEMQTKAHAVMYWQTSMSPQFYVAGIPAIQVGHRLFQDTLVRERLCDEAISTESFLAALDKLAPQRSPEEKAKIEKVVGVKKEWATIIRTAVDNILGGK